jgi:PIN domain nuclease of toxin-antitoxin system
VDDSPRLSSTAKQIIEDPAHERCMSIASFWEIGIKFGLGKLTLGEPLADFFTHHIEFNSIKILPITLDLVLAVSALPSHHRDPFDRMIIAQSIVEDMNLISDDSDFAAYPVKLRW